MKLSFGLKTAILGVLFFSFFLSAPRFLTAGADFLNECESIEKINQRCQIVSPQECKEVLKSCEEYLEEKSALIEKDLAKTEKEKKTLQSAVVSLKKKIESLDYQLYQGNLMMKELNLQIQDAQTSIDKTSEKIEDSRRQIRTILRTVYEESRKSLIEILFEGKLSLFFDNLVSLEGLNSKLQEILENTRDLKSYLEGQKNKMAGEKKELENVIKVQTLQKNENSKAKKEQEYLLKLTEAEYQKYLREKTETEKKAAAVRSRIFELIGVPKAPTFGEAYEIAKYIKELTGIRPALLLAVLTQESNIGNNVGQCYLKNRYTGEGLNIRTKQSAPRTMNPESEVPYFFEIIEKLNQAKSLARDPYETPVSCVMYYQGRPYGWGGAMGPSQFMPSTWQKAGYGRKVGEFTGKTADPWDIKDAFLATALYLKDLGALQNEFKAVMRYFSGSSWTKWEEFYGNSVLKIARGYEDDIKALEK